MARVSIQPLAKTDLREIAAFIETENPGRGISYVEKMQSVFSAYAEMPLIGVARPEISKELRSFPFGNYVIFYRPMQDGISVVRVLHGARDFGSIFS